MEVLHCAPVWFLIALSLLGKHTLTLVCEVLRCKLYNLQDRVYCRCIEVLEVQVPGKVFTTLCV